MKINKIIVGISFFIIFISYSSGILSSQFLLIYSMLINILILISFSKNPIVYIVFLMLFTVLLYLIPTYFLDVPLSEFFQYNKQSLFDQVLLIHTLFLVSFYLFFPEKINYIPLNKIIKRYNYPIIFWLLFFLILFVLLFMLKGSVVLFQENSYAIYKKNLAVESGLPEYLLIGFVLMFVFMKKKIQTYALMVLTVFYMAKLILLGYRVQAIMAILFFFFAFIDGKIKTKTIIVGSFFGFVLSLVYGNLKAGITEFSPDKLFIDLGYGFVMSHQSNMYYSTSVYIGLIEDNIMNFETRFVSFIGFILNMIVPSKYIKEYIPEGQIPTWVHQFADYGGGGLPDIYFYIWLGPIGVILFALFLALTIKITHNPNFIGTKYKNLLAIYVFMIGVTSARWVFYDPGNFLFRLPIYTLFFYLLIKALLSKKDPHYENN